MTIFTVNWGCKNVLNVDYGLDANQLYNGTVTGWENGAIYEQNVALEFNFTGALLGSKYDVFYLSTSFRNRHLCILHSSGGFVQQCPRPRDHYELHHQFQFILHKLQLQLDGRRSIQSTCIRKYVAAR